MVTPITGAIALGAEFIEGDVFGEGITTSIGFRNSVAAGQFVETGGQIALGTHIIRKRLRDRTMAGPPTKRIKHHARQPKLPGGEVSHRYYDQDDVRIGKLYWNRLRLPAQETFVGSKGRERHIYIKGFKIDAEWFGKHANSVDVTNPQEHPRGFMGPCVINYALIQMNCPQPLDPDPTDEFADDPIWLNFWEDWWSSHENDNQSRNFLQVSDVEPSGAKAKWQDYWIHGQINPRHPKGFKILARERTVCQQILQNGAGGPGQKNWGRVSKYYRIPQQVYLHNNEEAAWLYPIYSVFWISPLNPEMLLNYPKTENAALGKVRQFDFKQRVHCYFKELEK